VVAGFQLSGAYVERINGPPRNPLRPLHQGLAGLVGVGSLALTTLGLLGPSLATHPAVAATPSTPVAPPPPPRAWVLVDAARGTVLDAGNYREPLPPASLTKLLTALVATSRVGPDDVIPVSSRAEAQPPHKIGMRAGQVWPFDQALHALLMSSANDAAVAIGERVGGSLEGLEALLTRAGEELGLADNPVLRDPAGLDDDSSVGGGNLLSARDLAIVSRAALTNPEIAAVVATPIYEFDGPDGVHHRLINHNRLLRTYPGAVGMKTGYTRKAGNDLVGAARRGGRTMLAVLLAAPDPYRQMAMLLDRGFATPPSSAGTGDVLPPVVKPTGGPITSDPSRAPAIRPSSASHGVRSFLLIIALFTLAYSVVATTFTARRERLRRRRATRLRRHARQGGRTPSTRPARPTTPTHAAPVRVPRVAWSHRGSARRSGVYGASGYGVGDLTDPPEPPRYLTR